MGTTTVCLLRANSHHASGGDLPAPTSSSPRSSLRDRIQPSCFSLGSACARVPFIIKALAVVVFVGIGASYMLAPSVGSSSIQKPPSHALSPSQRHFNRTQAYKMRHFVHQLGKDAAIEVTPFDHFIEKYQFVKPIEQGSSSHSTGYQVVDSASGKPRALVVDVQRLPNRDIFVFLDKLMKEELTHHVASYTELAHVKGLLETASHGRVPNQPNWVFPPRLVDNARGSQRAGIGFQVSVTELADRNLEGEIPVSRPQELSLYIQAAHTVDVLRRLRIFPVEFCRREMVFREVDGDSFRMRVTSTVDYLRYDINGIPVYVPNFHPVRLVLQPNPNWRGFPPAFLQLSPPLPREFWNSTSAGLHQRICNPRPHCDEHNKGRPRTLCGPYDAAPTIRLLDTWLQPPRAGATILDMNPEVIS